MVKYLAIFDFDYTVVDDNTDTCYWNLIKKECKQPLIQQFNNEELTWHQLLNKLMPLLSWNDIIHEIQSIELTPGMRSLFDYLKQTDSLICIVSDSNTEFINKILEKQGLTDYVTEIHTNGIKLPKEGSQKVSNPEVITYEKAFESSCGKRDCDNSCNKNHMCKGSVVQQLVEKYDDYVSFFVGDGGNDYCAMKRIEKISGNEGLNFVRRGYNLEKKLLKLSDNERSFVNLLWSDANEIKSYLENK